MDAGVTDPKRPMRVLSYVAVGLAIVLQFYRLRATINSDEADTLRQ